MQVLLDVVVAAGGRDRPDALEPLDVIERARSAPRRIRGVVDAVDRVLAQPASVERRAELERFQVWQARLGGGVHHRVVDRRQQRGVGVVGVRVPEAAATRRLPGEAGLRVAEARGVRDRRRVVLDEDRELGARVAGVPHRRVDVEDRVLDRGGLCRHARGGHLARHRAVVVAVVRPPRRGVEEVGDAVGDDPGEVVVVAADRDRHERDVVRRRIRLEQFRLTLVPVAIVVEVESRLEVAAARVRLGCRSLAPEQARSLPCVPTAITVSFDFERWQPWIVSAVPLALS